MHALKTLARHSLLVRLICCLGAWVRRGAARPFARPEHERPHVPVVVDGSERAMRGRLAAGQADARLLAPLALNYWGERYVNYYVHHWTCVPFQTYLERPFHYEQIVAERAVAHQQRLAQEGAHSAQADAFRN